MQDCKKLTFSSSLDPTSIANRLTASARSSSVRNLEVDGQSGRTRAARIPTQTVTVPSSQNSHYSGHISIRTHQNTERSVLSNQGVHYLVYISYCASLEYQKHLRDTVHTRQDSGGEKSRNSGRDACSYIDEDLSLCEFFLSVPS